MQAYIHGINADWQVFSAFKAKNNYHFPID